MGLNPSTKYWRDVINASYYIQEINENKVRGMGYASKKIFKKGIVTSDVSLEYLVTDASW
jgi:hypothetical protein